MVKRLVPLFLAVILLLCACGQEMPAATPTPEAIPTPEVTQTPAEEAAPAPSEEPQVFSRGDYITDTAVSLDAGTFVFDIDENVFVPGHLRESSEALAAAMEEVSGLSFEGAGYGRQMFSDGKVHIRSSRDLLYAGQDWYQGLDSSEVGSAYASAWGHAELSPGDLFIGNSNAIAHELSHVLMYRQSEWSYCTLLNEGFAEYTTYLALLELEQSDPATAFYLDKPYRSLFNMMLNENEYAELFSHPLEYWFENTLECGNGNYTIGFRFMAYLQAVYGDYSKWITEFENTYCFANNTGGSNEAAASRQIEVLKACYGQDVLDNFYPWLKENQDLFAAGVNVSAASDLSSLSMISWYPLFSAIESTMKIEQLAYSDLYIDLEPAKLYLKEYKRLDISNLYLDNPNKLTVVCYEDDGSHGEPTAETNISLEGISYIRLLGEGKLKTLQIKGFAD